MAKRGRKKKKVVPPPLTPQEIEGRRWATHFHRGQQAIVIAPAGDCPHQLKETSLNAVRDWLESMIDEPLIYSPASLRYFIRHFYDIFTPKYRKVMKNLERCFGEYLF